MRTHVRVSSLRGVDCSTGKLSLPREFCSQAINMQFRGNEAATRPPFLIRESLFTNDEDKEVFMYGNVTGLFAYQKTIPNTESNLIIAVGDRILAGRVSANRIYWRRIFKGINPQWQSSFFCQADRFLIWQNGKDLPLYWDGNAISMSYCKDAPGVTEPMPIGNIMVYAHGRIFLANEENIVYASNYIYSSGLTGYGLFNFSEETYFNDGGGFGAPISGGRITGAFVIQKNPATNGHGPVIFVQERGGFAIEASLARTQWATNANIQQIVLTGRGCASPFSITYANSDVWYRCSDGSISSFKREIATQETWSNRSLSKEVRIYTEYDAGISLNYSFGLFVDNRILMSVGTRQESSTEYGYHRYAMGFVSLDMDDGSSVVSDQNFSWDGLWTGIRPTGTAELIVESQIYGFVSSYDLDGINRIYIIGSGVSNDIAEDGEREIMACFSNEGIFYNPQAATKASFSSSKVKFFDAWGQKIKVRQWIRPDDYLCWTPLHYKEMPGRVCDDQDECGTGETSGLMSGFVSSQPGCEGIDRIGSAFNATSAEWFGVLTALEGAMRIRSISYFADSSEEKEKEIEAVCIKEKIQCCDPVSDFITYSTNGK